MLKRKIATLLVLDESFEGSSDEEREMMHIVALAFEQKSEFNDCHRFSRVYCSGHNSLVRLIFVMDCLHEKIGKSHVMYCI